MKIINKIKANKNIFIILFLFFLISLITLYSVQLSFSIFDINLFYRQIVWYLLGFGLILVIMNNENKIFFNLSWGLYVIFNFLLLGLLFFAEPINNTYRWYIIPNIGTFQPSEFMKIILILLIANLIANFNQKHQRPTPKEEFVFLVKIFLIVSIPSLLTLLQPDTGIVIIYLFSTIIILFISGIRLRWFFYLSGAFVALITTILSLFFWNTDLFIKLLGTDFFLRVDRLLDWQSQAGFQLEHGQIAISAGHLTGSGIGKTAPYFPEPQTDFIFAVFANNFGFIGIILLFLIFGWFYYLLIKIALTTKQKNQYLIAGFIGILFYQQVQNIGMTFGLLPLTGITLPFISAGGSSLLSYFFLVGMIINITQEKKDKNPFYST